MFDVTMVADSPANRSNGGGLFGCITCFGSTCLRFDLTMKSARILKGSTLWPRAALIRTLDEYFISTSFLGIKKINIDFFSDV